MSAARPGPDFPALHVLLEHEACLTAVVELESWLDHPIDDGPAWLAAVQQVLPHMRDALQAHFASEEAGPLFRAVPQEFPHLSDRLRRLESEHAPLLAQATEACAHARALQEPEVYDLRELCGRLQLLVAKLRRHETEEDEAVLTAYWQEAGGGD